MSKKIEVTVPVIVEHQPGEETWRAFPFTLGHVQAEGATPEEASDNLRAEIDYFTSNPELSQQTRDDHRRRLSSLPEVGVTQIKVEIEEANEV